MKKFLTELFNSIVKESPQGAVTEYRIPLHVLLDRLNINVPIAFIQYDWTEKVLVVKTKPR